jgi:transcription-repair coupling factor (superfamily II helicase)
MTGQHVRFAPVDLPESRQVRVQRVYPQSIVKATTSALLVPRPTTARIGGTPLRDRELLDWVREVLDSVISPGAAAAPDQS